MDISQFDYKLPKNQIAQKQLKPRDCSRLLVLNPKTRQILHKNFYNIADFLNKGDVLVLNDSKVMPARLFGKKESGGKVEILLLKQKNKSKFEVLLKNFKEKDFKKMKQNGIYAKINLNKNLFCSAKKNLGGGKWIVQFNQSGQKLKKSLNKLGKAPLPPYIKTISKFSDYQTIYAKHLGSAAAPTAGLHFTKKLIDRLKKKGVIFCFITLHIGFGTFSPVRTKNISLHKIHSESAFISKSVAEKINKAKKDGKRVIAVGTTTARALESFAAKKNRVSAGHKETELFIYPPYKFKIIDGLITNFHLPKSSLLFLTVAFLNFKNKFYTPKKTAEIYKKAVKLKYRFFSFGDAMFIF